MRALKKILDFYLESSLHVAIAVYSLTQVTYHTHQIPPNNSLLMFAFLGTIVGYNFIKYDELTRIKKKPLTNRLRTIIAISFFSFLGCFYFFIQLSSTTKALGFLSLIITLLYTLPFIPNKKNMRNWSGIKIYLVSFAWVIITVLLPLNEANISVDLHLILISLQRFIFVLVLLLLFEINDLPTDQKYLKTVPQQIGLNKTQYLAYTLLLVFISIDYSHIKNNLFLSPTFIITIITFSFTFFSTQKNSKYFTTFWVESISILWWLLLLCITSIFN